MLKEQSNGNFGKIFCTHFLVIISLVSPYRKLLDIFQFVWPINVTYFVNILRKALLSCIIMKTVPGDLILTELLYIHSVYCLLVECNASNATFD